MENRLKVGYKPIELPPPECIQPMVWHAITLNPAPIQQIAKTKITLSNEQNPYTFIDVLWHSPLFYRASKLKVFLYPELSEKGKYHWHGYIIFEDYMSIYIFYRNFESMMNSPIETKMSVKMKVIDDENKWYDYCVKQRLLMECVHKYYSMPYVLTNKSLSKVLKLGDAWLPLFNTELPPIKLLAKPIQSSDVPPVET